MHDPIDDIAPGPWSWELHPDTHHPIALVSGKDDVLLCTGDEGGSWLMIDGDNMAAIQALPDLLDACRAAVHQLDYLQGLWGKEAVTDRLARTLRAAVAKATGSGSGSGSGSATQEEG